MKITIKDVAKKANVSISTVSYAINGSERISEETRDRVLKVANEMNYVANSNAKLLKQKKTKAIGLFFNSWFGPVYSELVRGIEQIVHQQGYDLVACSSYGDENSTAYKYLRDNMVDGAIVLTNSLDDEFLKATASKDLPLVVLDREISAPHIYNILIDNFGGAFSATKALIAAGCKDVHFFGGPEDAYDNQKRLEGYIAALGYYKIGFDSNLLISSDFTEKTAYQQMKDMLASGKTPSAIFSANDEMAIGIIRAANEYGINIPEEMKVVGFDNIRLAELIMPGLTTVSHQKHEMGQIAAETLFEAMNGKEPEDLRMLPTKMITRDTL
ncbi:LacI family DNA-binding transcriptional regulator (plasmid) [Photobacterium sp. DA100]|uniref:LacI family DNA-binding transcriptional regulator n=1 Tax=Photobacterium sp. DA100 TaxID=3027472 RepID=UPI002478E0AE|nr:LacI family DNA-binding transcriptional regulator [Photobacterium sp. DA100]WEM44563.1 LacI family DNA-binding transcriptional regulator [Photobacterium sp. DA100]